MNEFTGLGGVKVADLPEAASTALRGISKRADNKGL
jgi:hypothetical protein